MQNDIVAMAGYWEPTAFIVRGGRATRGLESDPYPYSEELAAKLADIGINLVVWHYCKGLGIETEAEEMGRTTAFFRHCENHGITKGVYINAGSVFVDTFFAETPDARDWIARDQWNQPQQYSEYYRAYFRWRLCSANPEVGAYVGKAAVQAVRESGAQHIHFDNSAQVPCYCSKCRDGFPQRLLEQYPPARHSPRGDGGTPEPLPPNPERSTFKDRFGYDYRGAFELPRGTARMPIDTMPAAHEPGLYEWVRYRQQQSESTLKTACDMIREASPSATIGWNIALDHGEFSGLVWGLDPESSYRCGTDYFFSEDANYAGIEDGRLISHIRTYKYGRAMNNRALIHNVPPGNDAVRLLNYTEAAAFNDGCLGHVLWATEPDDEQLDILKRAIRFFRQHRDVYIGSRCLARTALYRSAESDVANWADATISRLAVEQVLIKKGVQYDLIINDRIDTLSDYELLICPNTITVSDAVAETIAGFVRAGGRLLCTEMSFTVDEHGRRRVSRADMGLDGERDGSLGRTDGRADPSEILDCLGLDPGAAERIYFLPTLDYARTFTWDMQSSNPPVIGKDYFAEPRNTDELFDLLMGALGENDVQLKAPENVVAGIFETVDGRSAIHVLDYEAGRRLDTVSVRFRAGGSAMRARFITIDTEETIDLRRDGEFAVCMLPAFETYGFLLTEQASSESIEPMAS